MEWYPRSAEVTPDQAAQVLQHAPVAVICADEPGRVLFVNDRGAELLGRAREKVVNRPFVVLVSEEDRRKVVTHLAKVAKGSTAELDLTLRRPDGSSVPVSLVSAPVLDVASSLRYSIHLLHDITHRRSVEDTLSEAKERLAHIAHHDALTQLPNRYLFADRLQQAVLRCRRNGWLGALVFVDIDRFKYYNDAHGHGVGDAVLVEAAKRLSANVREQDTVCRYSGDEFLLILENVTSVSDAKATVEKLKREFSRPVYGLTAGTLTLSASFGVTMFDKNTKDVDALVRQADSAMYEAKKSPAGTLSLYSYQAEAQASARRTIAADLPIAIDEGQFEVVYQPQIEHETGAVAGVEALIRWNHPVLGELLPEAFIAIAETTGQSERICGWVLAQACSSAKDWLNRGLAFNRVAVNVSGRDVCGNKLQSLVDEALRSSGLPASKLEIEVTETSVMHSPVVAERVLEDLSSKGITISLDDFGTGYSSLLCLRNHPFKRIKIDQSFVSDLDQIAGSEIIVSAMVSMADSLGMEVVAEGVETIAQRDRLSRLGISVMQGYLYSNPLMQRNILEYLDGRVKRRAG